MNEYTGTTLTPRDGDTINCVWCKVNGNARDLTIKGSRNTLHVSHSIIDGDHNVVHGTGNTIRGDCNTVHGEMCFVAGDYTILYDSSDTSTTEGKYTRRYGGKSVSGGNSNISNNSNVSNSFNNCGVNDNVSGMGPGGKYTFVPSHSPVVTYYNTGRTYTPIHHDDHATQRNLQIISCVRPVVVDITSDDDEEEEEEKPKVPRATAVPVVVPVIRIESDEPEENSELACIICLERKRKCAAFPCRHLRYCHTCCLALQSRSPVQCSQCRTQVTHFEAFY